MLDVIISESSEKLNKSLYEKYFNEKLADLTVHHNGNFTVQKILLSTVDVTQVLYSGLKYLNNIKIYFIHIFSLKQCLIN